MTTPKLIAAFALVCGFGAGSRGRSANPRVITAPRPNHRETSDSICWPLADR